MHRTGLHLAAFDSSANIFVAAQVLALIKAVIASAIPPAASPIVTVPVIIIAVTGATITIAIGLR